MVRCDRYSRPAPKGTAVLWFYVCPTCRDELARKQHIVTGRVIVPTPKQERLLQEAIFGRAWIY